MPELPEVEVILRDLAPAVVGRRIVEVRIEPGSERLAALYPPRELARQLEGRRIAEASRRGKYLIFRLDDGRYFVVHLRMTGRAVIRRAEDRERPPEPFQRALVRFEDGSELRWADVRKFGVWQIVDRLVELERRLGPEPLSRSFTWHALAQRLAGRRAPVKAVLLDQRRIAGVGNIYADEALHLARIHPATPAGELADDQTRRLHRALRSVLRQGIRNFGSSFRDFVNAFGEEGRNREHLRVYGRAGEPCPRCGAPIERIVVASRGTHYCPRCQPSARRPAERARRETAAVP